MNKEEKYTVCPKCNHERYWPKYINYKEIDLCSLCGYWEPRDIEVGENVEYYLGLLDLDDNKKE